MTYYGFDYLTSNDQYVYNGLKWIAFLSLVASIPMIYFPIKYLIKLKK
jgi:hypothetical protein